MAVRWAVSDRLKGRTRLPPFAVLAVLVTACGNGSASTAPESSVSSTSPEQATQVGEGESTDVAPGTTVEPAVPMLDGGTLRGLLLRPEDVRAAL
jgi:hypothetical protein